MTATNHALTGAIIGALVANPIVAILAAFMSHFVLDALPHFGAGENFISSRTFKLMLLIDAALCVVLVSIVVALQPHHWWLISICAFLGTSPDLFWINHFLYVSRGKAKQWKPNLFSRFAAKIQWFEKPIGGLVEATYAVCAVIVLVQFLVRRG